MSYDIRDIGIAVIAGVAGEGDPGNTGPTGGSGTGLPADPTGYQLQLVSGVNIKTINGYSLLGSGNLFIDTTQAIADGGSF